MRSTGYLPREACPGTVDRITDLPDMTSAVDRGRKASTQTKNKTYAKRRFSRDLAHFSESNFILSRLYLIKQVLYIKPGL